MQAETNGICAKILCLLSEGLGTPLRVNNGKEDDILFILVNL